MQKITENLDKDALIEEMLTLMSQHKKQFLNQDGDTPTDKEYYDQILDIIIDETGEKT